VDVEVDVCAPLVEVPVVPVVLGLLPEVAVLDVVVVDVAVVVLVQILGPATQIPVMEQVSFAVQLFPALHGTPGCGIPLGLKHGLQVQSTVFTDPEVQIV